MPPQSAATKYVCVRVCVCVCACVCVRVCVCEGEAEGWSSLPSSNLISLSFSHTLHLPFSQARPTHIPTFEELHTHPHIHRDGEAILGNEGEREREREGEGEDEHGESAIVSLGRHEVQRFVYGMEEEEEEREGGKEGEKKNVSFPSPSPSPSLSCFESVVSDIIEENDESLFSFEAPSLPLPSSFSPAPLLSSFPSPSPSPSASLSPSPSTTPTHSQRASFPIPAPLPRSLLLAPPSLPSSSPSPSPSPSLTPSPSPSPSPSSSPLPTSTQSKVKKSLFALSSSANNTSTLGTDPSIQTRIKNESSAQESGDAFADSPVVTISKKAISDAFPPPPSQSLPYGLTSPDVLTKEKLRWIVDNEEAPPVKGKNAVDPTKSSQKSLHFEGLRDAGSSSVLLSCRCDRSLLSLSLSRHPSHSH